MKSYQIQLLNELSANGWELKSVIEEQEWWAETHWVISSVKENFGLELYISFLIDPLHEGAITDAIVTEIIASTQQPTSRLLTENTIIDFSLNKGRFDENLNSCILQLCKIRKKANL